jgi:hypothetical protein
MRMWWVMMVVLVTSVAHAQTDAPPPPPPADNPLPPGDFVPYEPAPEMQAAPPPQDPNALPPGIQVTPMPQPAATTSEEPVKTPARRAPADGDCKGGGKGKGFFRGAIPTWAGGALVGGAVGTLGFSLVGLGLAAALNFAMVQRWMNYPPSNLPGVYVLPLVAAPLGALTGAIIGGVVSPFLPNIPLTRPCLEEAGSDPTQRRSGTTGTAGSGTAG